MIQDFLSDEARICSAYSEIFPPSRSSNMVRAKAAVNGEPCMARFQSSLSDSTMNIGWFLAFKYFLSGFKGKKLRNSFIFS